MCILVSPASQLRTIANHPPAIKFPASKLAGAPPSQNLERYSVRLASLVRGSDSNGAVQKLENLNQAALPKAICLIESLDEVHRLMFVRSVIVPAAENPFMAGEFYDFTSILLKSISSHAITHVCMSMGALVQNPHISSGQVKSISDAVERLPLHMRIEFFEHGIAKLFASSGMSTHLLEKLLDAVVSSINSGMDGVLPSWTIATMNCGYFHGICGYTKKFFLHSLANGTLVKTTATIGGEEKTLFVKGFWSETGNVLAFEPLSNSVYGIKISHGIIVETKLKWVFSHNDLQSKLIGLVGA